MAQTVPLASIAPGYLRQPTCMGRFCTNKPLVSVATILREHGVEGRPHPRSATCVRSSLENSSLLAQEVGEGLGHGSGQVESLLLVDQVACPRSSLMVAHASEVFAATGRVTIGTNEADVLRVFGKPSFDEMLNGESWKALLPDFHASYRLSYPGGHLMRYVGEAGSIHEGEVLYVGIKHGLVRFMMLSLGDD